MGQETGDGGGLAQVDRYPEHCVGCERARFLAHEADHALSQRYPPRAVAGLRVAYQQLFDPDFRLLWEWHLDHLSRRSAP
ncbi:hypothetical protein [Streptomyces sp. NBC_00019]|uniref:hypothetical protein n=1 Tax=Streptomyces sp. NBC_00019 TaxID=2975623 RepID=UPI00324D1D2D